MTSRGNDDARREKRLAVGLGTGEGTKSVMTQGNWTEAPRRGSHQAQVFRGIPRLRVSTAGSKYPARR